MANSIMFCTPCYGGMAHAKHMLSGLALKETLEAINLNHAWNVGENESLVHRARMEMVASFLDTGHSHLMWLDADIEYRPDDVAKLWNLDADIAVAFYSMKRPDMPLSAWVDGKLVDLDSCPKEPFAVDYAGTGFMLIKRSAFEKVISHIRRKEVRAAELLSQVKCANENDRLLVREMVDAMASSYEGNNGVVPALFTAHTFGGGLESEDYHFCRVAREAGLQIIGDPSIRLKHWGQYAYGD